MFLSGGAFKQNNHIENLDDDDELIEIKQDEPD